MARFKIIKYGHPLLREKAFDVKKWGSRERELIAAMFDTMYTAKGVGLAAPQVGVLERIFVVDANREHDDDDVADADASSPKVFVNPQIVWESDDDDPYHEGCLSIPGLEGEVYRPSRVRISARDENFEPFEVEVDDLLARVVQHEADHLDGILFVDKLSLLKRSVLAGQLNKMKKASLDELPDLGETYPIIIQKKPAKVKA